jgi:hypothetical protein
MNAASFLDEEDAPASPAAVSAQSFLDSPTFEEPDTIKQQQSQFAADSQAKKIQGETFESYLADNPTPSTVTAQKLLTLAKTPEQLQLVANYVKDTKSPELDAPGTAGQIWQAVNQGPIPEGEHLLQANPTTTTGKVALGVERSGEDLGNFFLSPMGIATLGIGALPRAAQRGVALAFAAQMASQVPGDTAQLIQEVSKPADQRDWTKIAQMLTTDTANTIFAGLGASHGFAPKADFISKALSGELDKAKPDLSTEPDEPVPKVQEAGPKPPQVGVTAEQFLNQQDDSKVSPPTESPAAPPVAEKIESPKVVQAVSNMSTDEFFDFTKKEQGGLTGSAYRLGQSVSTPEELQSLVDQQAKFSDLAAQARASKDFNAGFDAASRKQFFREAYEAATGTGSAGDSLRKTDPNYKPPFPQVKVAAPPVVEAPKIEPAPLVASSPPPAPPQAKPDLTAPVLNVKPPELTGVNSGALGVVGMGGAKPTEFIPNNQTPTGIKNATVETERKQRGLPAAIEPLKRSFGDVWDQSMAKIDKDPGIQDRLIDELRDKPRPVSDTEDALLLHRQVDLQNDYAKATRELAQAYDDSQQFPNRLDDVEEWKSRVAGLSDKLFDLYEINKRVGTETSRGLNARKMMANEDFSLAQMELAKRAANGGRPLTDDERADVQKLHDRIRVLEEQNNSLSEQAKEAQSKAVADTALDDVEKTAETPVEPHIKTISQRIVETLNKQADEARKRIAARSGRLRTGIDPTELADYAIIGASHIGRGILKFSEWSKTMLDEFGDAVRPHLQQIFDAANKSVDDTVTRATSPQNTNKVKRLLRTAPIADRQKQAEDTIRERLSQGKKSEISGTVRNLARIFVESGIKDRDKLIDAVHGVLKSADPTITRREAMDAISGYGDFKQLSKDQISTQLRDLKGQMQQVAKLEDITTQKPPLKTGVERRAPSDEERRLIKEVNEAKRRFGIVVTDPATQLRSAIQARKTYYENQIKDLDQQIQQKQPFLKQRTPPPTDAALKALIERRNELKHQYNQMFPKTPLTDEQRVQAALRTTDRQISEIENQLKSGEIFNASKPPKPSSPELEAKRARLEELKQERQWARDTIQPPPDKDPERIALEALKKRMQSKMDDLNERVATGDFSLARKSEPVKLDDKGLKIKADYERAKAQFERALTEDRLKNRSPLEKLADTVVKWRRGFVLSSPITLGKLVAAAVERIAFSPAEEAIGGAISKVIPKVARQAKSEGGFNARAEAKAITEALTKGASDSWDILKTGQSELDALYGGGREGYVRESMTLPRSFIDVFGHIHGFLKAPTKRAAFARSMEKRTAAAIRDGVDVSDPMVQTKLAVESYKDANRSIFLQDNRLVTFWKTGLAVLDQKDKETGRTPVGSKALSTALRVALPIVKVPTNLVAETFQYAFGSITGSARLAKAMAAGVENLKPLEADLIMRELKKGSLGAALLLVGYFNSNNIGGYYQQGQKRKDGDVKIGGIRIAGHEIPSFLLHNPLLETLQLGATIRRAQDSKMRVHDKDSRGLFSGFMAGVMGLADEVPFVREMFGEIPKMFNQNEQSSFWGELGKSLVVPQIMQWAASQTDKDEKGVTTPRSPQTVWQHIETGLPFLRKNVPMKNQRRKTVLSE